MLSYSEVGEILSLIDSSSCDEVVLETEGVKLVVRRKGAGAEETPPQVPARSAGGTPEQSGQKPAAAQAAPPSSSGATEGEEIISAPMVGTFYRAPSPEDPPFVEVGTKVNVGDPICVIEVMKLFTTVHAEVAGTITQIGPQDGQLVEYGQMIFAVEPG
uniref:acetyl-CoA carboxylase biotin carboxyl carrier protein n=1 Tax=Roseovarius indicus TaxID=540747 RepID=UPI003B52FB30